MPQGQTPIAPRPMQGFTLVELMVASAISLLLLAGVIQIFLANKQTYNLQQSISFIQENSRFALEFLGRDIRMGGFMGCISTSPITISNNLDPSQHGSDINNTAGAFDGTGGLAGYTYSGTFPTGLADVGLSDSEVVEDTDALLVMHASPCPGGDVVCHNNTSGGSQPCPSGTVSSAQYKIADNSVCNVRQNDIVLISNCQTADLHAVTNVPGTSTFATLAHAANLNLSPKLSNTYGPGAAIFKMQSYIYYVGVGASGEPALFRRSLYQGSYTNEELIEGVYDMAIEYGMDTDDDGSANFYAGAADIETAIAAGSGGVSWENVTVVRITLAIRSARDNIIAQPSTYDYDGASVTDRRLRRSYSSTFFLRNRI